EHRQIKYRNNVIECDHGKLKRIIGATLGFKSMKTAYAALLQIVGGDKLIIPFC
ncbi:transposase, partial [Escherichia coli]